MTLLPSAEGITAWTSASSRRWFAECDALNHVGRRRTLVNNYFEGYDLEHVNAGWIYICSSCLVEELGDRLAKKERR